MMGQILFLCCLPAVAWAQSPLPTLEIPVEGSVPQNLLVALLALIFSQAAASPLKSLESSGLFPFVLRIGVFGGRLVAAMAFLAAFFTLLPESLRPAVPWVLVAAGVALGWSARDMLRDLLAAVVLLVERRIRPGIRLRTQDHSGVVSRMGFRAVYLESDEGAELGVPNRVFLSRAYELDTDPHLPIEIRLRIRSPKSTDQIRESLIEMALFSPFLAPGHRPEAVRDPEEAGMWLLKCRLLSSQFIKAFEGALEEQIETSLEKNH
jgi:small-conductance mechanosensitive channel